MEFRKEMESDENAKKSLKTDCRNATFPMRFASSKLQKTIELHARQQGRASMMHPPHCDLQTRSCKTSKNYCTCATTMQNNIDAATPVRFAGCKGQRIVCATTTQNNIDVDTPLGFASTIALCSQVRSFSCPNSSQNQISAPKPKNSNLEDLEDYEKPKKI